MKYFTILLLVASLAGTARSQFTLTTEEWLAMNGPTAERLVYASSALPSFIGDLATSGINKSWDFGKHTFGAATGNAPGVRLPYPSGAALASDSDFVGSTDVVETVSSDSSTTTFEFFKVDATGIWLLGVSERFGKQERKITGYATPLQLFRFPMGFETVWSSIATVHTNAVPPGVTVWQRHDGFIDAWGTFITPDGKSHAALRERSEDIQGSSVADFTSHTYSFQWFTKDGYGATVATDSSQQITSASYFTPRAQALVGAGSDLGESSPSSLNLDWNPVSKSEMSVRLVLAARKEITVSLLDILGRSHSEIFWGVLAAGESFIPIVTQSLENGIYFVRAMGDGVNTTQKFVVAH